MDKFRFVDLFCGGGGSITGCIDALKSAGVKYEGRGYNHWDIAIRTIQMNYPEIVPDFARACTPIEAVVPDEIFDVDPQRIDVIWASPSCTHHSIAKGGKPRSNQLRSQPENIIPYIRLTKCRRLYVENVKELESWGPLLDKDTVIKGKLYKAGMPDPREAGKFFNLWIREIKASGYKVDLAYMNSADYGAATSRDRLIIQAVRKSAGEKIIWPEPSHSQYSDLFGYKPWRSAAEIIDWSIPGKSIFGRKKPLCENTIRRIEAGIKKYWGEWAEPFLIVLRGTSDDQLASSAIPLSSPLPTITTSCAHIALIRPFLTRYNGGENRNLFIPQHGGGAVKPVSVPLSTIATTGSIGIVEGQILVMPDGKRYKLDITHRMLTTKELAAATGFPCDYRFAGDDSAAKKQIGNAVCPSITSALYKAFLAA